MFKKQKKFYHSCLNTDSYDKRSFERLQDLSPKIQSIEAEGEKVFPGFMNTMGDMWSSLYKNEPRINPEASGKALTHKPLIERVMESKEFEDLRKSTVLDEFSSAMGSMSLGENTVQYIEKKLQQDEQLKEQMKQMQQQQQQQETLEQQQKKHQEKLDERQEQGKKPTKAQEKKKQSLEDQLKQMEQQMQQQQQQIGQQLADGMNVGQMASQAKQEAKEAKEGLEDLVSGPQAGSGKGEMEKMPLRTQLELAHQLKKNSGLRKVAEWAGRFKTIARKKQKSKSIESVERQGIVQGDNTELLLPTELVQLKNPATKLDFLKRFTEKQTLQYAPKGKESTGKGPIVLCLDQSGSMLSLKEQAAGFALAIAMIAKSQKRDFAYIPFESDAGEVLYFSKGKMDSNSILKIATEFMSGGTSFQRALYKAVEVIEKSQRFNNADIIFVTDGDDRCNDEFLAEYNRKKKSLQFQCMSVALNTRNDHTLKKFSDEIFNASNLLETAEGSGVFGI